ncbi:MAG: hypothetical protein IKJ44_06515 [Elusimicrobiaceae bacterium]|nr:hypothetical protein [Elusimicrobiaceae bacterium]
MRFFFFFLLFCFCIPSAVAAPFSLDEGQIYNQLTQRIIHRQPIRYYLNDPKMKPEVEKAFTGWFTNSLFYLSIRPKQSQQAAPFIPYLEFGANAENYIKVATEQESDISIYYEKDLRAFCSRGTAGCLKNGNRLYLIYPGVFNSDNYVLKHELGHAFGLEDLYTTQYPATGPAIGSGPRKAIMHNGTTLTCDDADGLIHSIFLALRRENPQMQDFSFTSLCDEKRKFYNAYMQNRPPAYVDFKGKRTLYTYCTDGTPHSIVQIDPTQPQNLYSVLQAPKDCPYINAKGEISHGITLHSQDIMHAPQQTSFADVAEWMQKNTLYELDLPASKITLQAVLDSKDIPGYLFLFDENKRPIYLFAYLKNDYNVVFNFYLDGRPMYQGEALADYFIYNRQNPKLFYVDGGTCHAPQEQCQEMQALMNKYFLYFAKKHRLPASMPGWSTAYSRDNIMMAQEWEKFFLAHFTPIYILEEKIKQDISHQRAKVYKEKTLQRPAW